MTIDTTYLDSGADKVKPARPAILAMAQEINAIGASGGASRVGYLPSGTGAVTTDVQSKLRESVSILDFVDEGVDTSTTDCSAAVSACVAAHPGATVDGAGGVYKVTSLPQGRNRFVNGYWRRLTASGVLATYPMHDTIGIKTSCLAYAPDGAYRSWPQDKFCTYKAPQGNSAEIVISAWNEGSGHGADDMHLVMRRSTDGGNSWEDEEHHFGTDGVEGSVWSMGVVHGQLMAIVRRGTGGSFTDHELYGRRLYERREMVSQDVSTTNGSAVVVLQIENHGLIIGNTINIIQFSASIGGITLSGIYNVNAVTNKDSFSITAGSAATSTATGNRNFYIEFLESDWAEITFGGLSFMQALNAVPSTPFPAVPTLFHGFAQDRNTLDFYVGVHGGAGNVGGPYLVKVSNSTLAGRSMTVENIAGLTNGVEPSPAVDSAGNVLVGIRKEGAYPLRYAFKSIGTGLWEYFSFSNSTFAHASPSPIRVAQSGEVLSVISDTRTVDGFPGYVPIYLIKWDSVSDYRLGFGEATFLEIGRAYFSNTNISDGGNAVGVPSLSVMKNGRIIAGYSSEHAPIRQDDDGQPSVYVVTIDDVISGSFAAYDIQGVGGVIDETERSVSPFYESNANGTYYKYADGRLVCEKTVAMTAVAVTTASGSLFCSPVQTWTFPHPFISSPHLQCAAQRANDTAMGGVSLRDSPTVSAATWILWLSVSATAGVGTRVAFLRAEGRWK